MLVDSAERKEPIHSLDIVRNAGKKGAQNNDGEESKAENEGGNTEYGVLYSSEGRRRAV